MKLRLLLIFVLLLPLVNAQSEYETLSKVTIDLNLDATVKAVGSSLSSLKADVYLIPLEDEMQQVLKLKTFSTPQVASSGNYPVSFEWKSFSSTYDLGYDATIENTHKIYQVPKIEYPLKDISAEYNQYLQPEELIDITPEIVAQTSKIIQNEDNAYLAVHKIADWTKTNIEYDLNSVTADQSLKSSWVLQNKQGVCDELTSLFISMCRAAGIPARFVSGVAYTNVLDEYGNHGWAEVYFPDYGWVPYDVTFGQFGWIDPSHITLSRTLDSAEPSIKYTWKSSGTTIDPQGITTNAETVSKGDKIDPIFDMEINSLLDKAGPSSYFPIVIELENPYDAYLTTQVVITKAPGVHDSNAQMVALRPKEKKDVYFIGKVQSDLQAGYTYTSVLEAEDSFGSDSKSQIEIAKNYEIYTLEEVQDMIDSIKSTEQGQGTSELVLNCNPTKDYFYLSEKISISCLVRNLGEKKNSLEICFEDQPCNTFSLANLEEKEVKFETDSSDKIRTIILKSNDFEIKRNVLLNLYEKPDLQITDINYPLNINYNEPMKIEMELYSPTLIKNIQLKVNGLSTIEIPELIDSKSFTINLNSKDVSSGKINFKIEYYDEYGKKYNTNKEFNINVSGAPWYQKLINWIMSLLA